MDLKKLEERYSAILTDMENCQTKIGEVKGDDALDDEARGKSIGEWNTTFDDLKKQADEVEVEIAEAKSFLDRKSKLAELRKAREIPLIAANDDGNQDPKGKGQQAAIPIDHQREAREYKNIFLDYMCGQTLEGKAFAHEGNVAKALAPKRAQGASAKAQEGHSQYVVVPDLFKVAMFGAAYAHTYGKSRTYAKSTEILFDADAAGLPTDLGGGKLRDDGFVPELFTTPIPQWNIMDRTRIVPAANGRALIPQLNQTDDDEFAGVAFEWTEEGSTKPATNANFIDKQILTHELSGIAKASQTILRRNQVGLEAALMFIFREAARQELDRVILRGSGTGQPLGILNTAGVKEVNRGTPGDVDFDDLNAMCFAIKQQFRAGSRFTIADTVEQRLAGKKDNDGKPLFRASTAELPQDMLLGKPYTSTYLNPSLGANGDTVLGNYQWYWTALEEEVTIARSTEAGDAFERALVFFRLLAYVGGRPMAPRAFAKLVGQES